MFSIEEAREKLATLASGYRVPKTESLAVDKALGRILAIDIIAPINVPPEANSAMDGFAFRHEDLTKSLILPISQRITAGSAPEPLARESAARIFTGALIPLGANAVAMQENCEILEDGKQVKILCRPSPGENIRPAGEDIALNSTVLGAGTRLNSAHLGLLASLGFNTVNVYAQLKVALFSTGNELIEPGKPLARGQIYDSNRSLLLAMLQQWRVEVVLVDRIPDEHNATVAALRAAAQCADLVISCGGVSVGEEDHIKTALEEVGSLDFWKVKMKPGKPLSVGRIDKTLFIGLPGNPVSAFVSLFLFGSIVLRSLQGEQEVQTPSFWLPLNFDISAPRSRPEFMRVRYSAEGLIKFPHQGSGILSSVAWADALALIPNDTLLKKGELVEVFPLSWR